MAKLLTDKEGTIVAKEKGTMVAMLKKGEPPPTMRSSLILKAPSTTSSPGAEILESPRTLLND
jgi:hypothetical protein